jgi:hypothetical protein
LGEALRERRRGDGELRKATNKGGSDNYYYYYYYYLLLLLQEQKQGTNDGDE